MSEAELLAKIRELERMIKNPDAYRPDRTIATFYSTNAGQNISNNASPEEVVKFEDKTIDTHGAYNTSTGVFTSPARRFYSVDTRILFTTTTAWALGEVARLSIYKSGAIYRYLDYDSNMDSSGTSLYKPLQGSISIFLDRGETLDIRAYQNSGGALALHNSNEHNWLSIISLRD